VFDVAPAIVQWAHYVAYPQQQQQQQKQQQQERSLKEELHFYDSNLFFTTSKILRCTTRAANF